VNQSRLNDTGAQGKKRTEKRRDSYRGRERNGRTRQRGRGEEGENKISPPPLERTAQRQWIDLTKETEETKEEKRSLLS
jgi:hypothetical protein